jgi:hypothetical protein
MQRDSDFGWRVDCYDRWCEVQFGERARIVACCQCLRRCHTNRCFDLHCLAVLLVSVKPNKRPLHEQPKSTRHGTARHGTYCLRIAANASVVAKGLFVSGSRYLAGNPLVAQIARVGSVPNSSSIPHLTSSSKRTLAIPGGGVDCCK